jgi:rod shape-determining protein MreC
VVGVVLGRIQSAQRTNGRFDPVGKTVQTLVSPVARFGGATVDGVSDFTYGLVNAQRLTRENRRMRAELAAQSLYTETMLNLEQQYDDLRKNTGLPPIPGRTVLPAAIVGYFPYENRITLGVGSTDGVSVGMPVETAKGLVGTVQTVDSHRCQVQLLASAGLTIGAIDGDRHPASAGMLQGESASRLSLILPDPNAPISLGDRIYTSGYSDFIPRGIPIGQVIGVDSNPEFGTHRATVFPFVQMGDLREVVVLK